MTEKRSIKTRASAGYGPCLKGCGEQTNNGSGICKPCRGGAQAHYNMRAKQRRARNEAQDPGLAVSVGDSLPDDLGPGSLFELQTAVDPYGRTYGQARTRQGEARKLKKVRQS